MENKTNLNAMYWLKSPALNVCFWPEPLTSCVKAQSLSSVWLWPMPVLRCEIPEDTTTEDTYQKAKRYASDQKKNGKAGEKSVWFWPQPVARKAEKSVWFWPQPVARLGREYSTSPVVMRAMN